MVEENAATGARLDGELERARGECATLRGELRDVRGALPVVLNNNNGTGSSTATPGSNSNNNATASNSNASSQETIDAQQQQSQEDGKRFSAGSSPVEKRSSASDKSVSPIDKRTSPVDRKERNSPIDRRASPIGTLLVIAFNFQISQLSDPRLRCGDKDRSVSNFSHKCSFWLNYVRNTSKSSLFHGGIWKQSSCTTHA